MPDIKAVIFDLDGTLVHSNLDFRRIRREIACPDEVDILEHIAQLSAEQKVQAQDIVEKHEWLDARTASVISGVHETLDALREREIFTAVVTRNSAKATRFKMESAELDFDLVFTREDAPAKPNPAALLEIAQRWDLQSEHCVYVGDYIYDLQAAHNAGMIAGLFAPGKRPPYADDAHFVFDNWQDFDKALASARPVFS